MKKFVLFVMACLLTLGAFSYVYADGWGGLHVIVGNLIKVSGISNSVLSKGYTDYYPEFKNTQGFDCKEDFRNSKRFEIETPSGTLENAREKPQML